MSDIYRTSRILLVSALTFATASLALAQGDGEPVNIQSRDLPRLEPGGEPVWVELIPDSREGAPVDAFVTESTEEGFHVQISIPGVWVSLESYGGEPFTVIDFPEIILQGDGFPRNEDERGWYDFPEETNYPPLDPAPYREALTTATPRFFYPEEALRDPPQTAEEMEARGVNPAGARPRIPHMRGQIAVSSTTRPDELELEITHREVASLQLDHPLIPAGFDGLDAEEEEGWEAPELIDREFYELSREPYSGIERSFGSVQRAPALSSTLLSAPLASHIDAATVNVPIIWEITVKHLAGPVDFDCPLPWDHWVFKNPYVNGQALREGLTATGRDILASRSARYLILTPEEYHEDLMPFALWKNQKGLNIDFAFVGNDSSADVEPDRDAVNRYIENYFKEHYCHGVYVLLVGTTDDIPSGRTDYIDTRPDFEDSDSDHVYQVIGDDIFPSLYLGRLFVENVDELNVQLDKILAYERTPIAGDWPLHVTLAANSENYPDKYAEAVNEIADYDPWFLPGYNPQPAFNVLHAGADDPGDPVATNADVVDAVNAELGHVLYRGHGGERDWRSGWDGDNNRFVASHIDQMENAAYPIVYSIACRNSRYRINNFISGVWMNHEAGAVATFGATGNSYTWENHDRAKGIFRAIFRDGYDRLGPAIARAESISHTMTSSDNHHLWENNTFIYVLLGDPEMTIRRAPIPSRSELIAELVETHDGFGVSLADNREPVSRAFVNIRLKDGVAVNAFTGLDGVAPLDGIHPDDVAEIQIHADGYVWNNVPLAPEQPVTLLPQSWDGEGPLQLSFQGEPGIYAIDHSSDLQEWTPMETILHYGGEFSLEDHEARNVDQRFYRATREDDSDTTR